MSLNQIKNCALEYRFINQFREQDLSGNRKVHIKYRFYYHVKMNGLFVVCITSVVMPEDDV